MTSVNNHQSTSTVSNIKNVIKGNFQKILALPDKYQKLRIVFDIAIIALSIISMISILLTTGLGGPIFFAIVPLIGFMGLGFALLISDTVKNKKVRDISEKITAFAIPLIILGSGIAFITAGVLSIPTSAAFLGTPQFILGITISGLALTALKNITIPKLFVKKNESPTKKNRSITTNSKKNTASTKTNKIINQRKKNQINQERKTVQRKNITRKKETHKYTIPKNISSKKK